MYLFYNLHVIFTHIFLASSKSPAYKGGIRGMGSYFRFMQNLKLDSNWDFCLYQMGMEMGNWDWELGFGIETGDWYCGL